MPTRIVPLVAPIHGINRVMGREAQPSTTCWDALNMLPYDRYGRLRVAQRFGTTKQYSTVVGVK